MKDKIEKLLRSIIVKPHISLLEVSVEIKGKNNCKYDIIEMITTFF